MHGKSYIIYFNTNGEGDRNRFFLILSEDFCLQKPSYTAEIIATEGNLQRVSSGLYVPLQSFMLLNSIRKII